VNTPRRRRAGWSLLAPWCRGDFDERRQEGGWQRGRPPSRSRIAAGAVWLGFIIAPIVDAVGHGESSPGQWLATAGALAFSALYIWLVLSWFDEGAERRTYALSGLQLAIAIALTVVDRPGWGYLFTYCAACAALAAPSPFGFPAVLVCSAVSVGATLIGGANAGTAIGFGTSTVGVGLLLTLMRDLRIRNQELTEARAELARTAVAAERERFARDLHDLLGHSLSVITIKAELAGRLLPGRPSDAAGEIRDVEQVARQALSEVRDAVSGYWQPTLAGEMEGARIALSAAGIIAEFERSPVTLAPDVEAVLAWTVREGATNVIRHSGASHCQVKVLAGLSDAGVEVVDDGPGAGPDGEPESGVMNGGGGHGLSGLTERAESLCGRMEAGALPAGGFRLAVSVPVSAAAS
jgi:two-component system sensor histidine kinase DesK